MTVLLVANYGEPAEWRRRWAALAPGVELRVWPDLGRPEEIVMAAIDDVPPEGLLASLPGLKCVQYLGHGVADVLDRLDFSSGVMVARLADPGIVEGMVEYVLGQIFHRRWHGATFREQQARAEWKRHPIALAAETHVGVLGLGPIGEVLATRLAGLGFRVSAWARGPHVLEGVACRSGPEALDPLLATLDYIVCVLPETAATRGLIDAERLKRVKQGAYLINVGRGSLIDEDALIAALDSGPLAGATLDVFASEPLPAEHGLWHHPKIVVTPHCAGGRATTSVEATAENYRRLTAGLPLLNAANPKRGY